MFRAGRISSSERLGSFATQLEVMAQAESVEDLFARLEGAGQLLRIDQDCWPTMFRYATVTQGELEALRQVRHVIRLGHVVRIERSEIILERGNVSTGQDWLYVDCSAAGLRNRPPVPIFDDGRITLQYVIYGGQPTYSATLIAFVELEQLDDDAKNLICHPIPVSGNLTDVPRNMLARYERPTTSVQISVTSQSNGWVTLGSRHGSGKQDRSHRHGEAGSHEALSREHRAGPVKPGEADRQLVRRRARART